MPRPLKDHSKLQSGKVPFKFKNMWLKVEGFSDLIKKWWQEVEVEGFASFVLVRKVNFVKEELKK